MLQLILKRIAIAIPIILIVASLTFFLVRMAPGGPFDAEKVVPPQVMKNLNAVYNLDAPLIIQYRDYMLNLVQGDFGPSFRYPGRSVTEMIFTGLPVTFELAFYAIIVAMIIGSFAGVIAAVKRNTFLDYVPMTIAMIGICMPTFLLGPLLVLYFGIYLEVLPVSGWDSLPGDKILPSINNWGSNESFAKGGRKVSNDFEYSSDKNTDWMNVDEIQKWIETNIDLLLAQI